MAAPDPMAGALQGCRSTHNLVLKQAGATPDFVFVEETGATLPPRWSIAVRHPDQQITVVTGSLTTPGILTAAAVGETTMTAVRSALDPSLRQESPLAEGVRVMLSYLAAGPMLHWLRREPHAFGSVVAAVVGWILALQVIAVASSRIRYDQQTARMHGAGHQVLGVVNAGQPVQDATVAAHPAVSPQCRTVRASNSLLLGSGWLIGWMVAVVAAVMALWEPQGWALVLLVLGAYVTGMLLVMTPPVSRRSRRIVWWLQPKDPRPRGWRYGLSLPGRWWQRWTAHPGGPAERELAIRAVQPFLPDDLTVPTGKLPSPVRWVQADETIAQ